LARLEHAAIWTHDIERLQAFYQAYFEANAGAKYVNLRKGFESIVLTFDSCARLKLMRIPTLAERRDDTGEPQTGYAHLAFSIGSEQAVDALTTRLRAEGHRVLDGPRRTGDGYYESVVLDPDSNRIEITV
jgi:lactoylglutathione lyase